jgi:hypothetical protein
MYMYMYVYTYINIFIYIYIYVYIHLVQKKWINESPPIKTRTYMNNGQYFIDDKSTIPRHQILYIFALH